jgi:hypothetical protein
VFYPPADFRNFSRVIIGFCLFLLLVLGLAEFFPLYADYPNFINNAGLQRVRVEVLVSSMLIMQYRSPADQTNAVAVIETALPVFRQEETTLQDDPSPDIQAIMLQAQPNYLALVAAAQTVVANPTKPVDPVQVNIMIAKRDAYRMAINQVVVTLVQHAEESTRNLFYVKTGIAGILAVTGTIYWIVLEKRMKHVIAEEGTQAKSEPLNVSS